MPIVEPSGRAGGMPGSAPAAVVQNGAGTVTLVEVTETLTGLTHFTSAFVRSPDGTKTCEIRVNDQGGVSLRLPAGGDCSIVTAEGASLSVAPDLFHYTDPNAGNEFALTAAGGLSVGVGTDAIFQVDANGAMHGVTGQALTFDL